MNVYKVVIGQFPGDCQTYLLIPAATLVAAVRVADNEAEKRGLSGEPVQAELLGALEKGGK